MKYALILVLLLLVGSFLHAQSQQTIVIDRESKKTIPYATICWQYEKIKGFAVSNKDGKAALPSERMLQLAVSSVGYKTYQDTCIVGDTIFLLPDVLNLDQVVVTGTRTEKRLLDSPIQTTVIASSELSKAGSTTTMEALQDYLPGMVTTPNAMGNNLRIKGLNSRYILFLVDGERLVSEGAGGNVNLDQIDMNNIERIEMVNGAASALYGSNAVGAVINIITKKPTHAFEGQANGSLATNNTLKSGISLGSNSATFECRLSLFRNSSDGFNITDGPYAARYTDYGTNLKTGYKPTEQLRVNGTVRLYQHETFNLEESMNVTHSLERSVTGGLSVQHNSKSKKNHLRASVNFDKYFDYDVLEKKGNALALGSDASYLSARMVETYTFNPQLELVGGAEYNHEQNFSETTLGAGPTSKTLDDFNLFAQVQHELFNVLETVFGARYTYNSAFGNSFNPKLSLMYKVQSFTLRGGTGTAFRAPSIKELYYDFDHNGSFWVYGNPDLIAEKGFYNSLSVEFTEGKINASLSVYHNSIDNKITMYEVINALGGSEQYYQNVSSATLKGVDANLNLSPIQNIVIKASYSYSDAIDESTGLQLSSNVKHSGTCSAVWNGRIARSPLSLQMTGRFTSPKLYESVSIDDQGEELVTKESSEPFNIWKVTAVKPIRLGSHLIELTAKCDNMFDFEATSFIDSGRQYFVGLRYKFK